jgi:Spy/CpxP family protein refolding chaperone
MKRLIKVMSVLALMLITNMGFAQRGGEGRGAEMVSKMTARLTEKLILTADQQSKVSAILTAHKTNMKSVREQMKNASSKEEKLKLRKAAWDKLDTDISAVLTDEQKPKYTAYKQQMREDFKANRGGKGKEGMGKDFNDDVY